MCLNHQVCFDGSRTQKVTFNVHVNRSEDNDGFNDAMLIHKSAISLGLSRVSVPNIDAIMAWVYVSFGLLQLFVQKVRRDKKNGIFYNFV